MNSKTCLLVTAMALAHCTTAKSGGVHVPSVLIKVVEHVEVPARQSGALEEVGAREGAMVETGALLAKIEDADVQLDMRRAPFRLLAIVSRIDLRQPVGAPGGVTAGLGDLGVEFPVAIDAGRDLWHAYGCEGWPSLFLWTTGGALSWFHFGEGEYLGTEEAIQEELRQLDALRTLPEPMDPLRPTDAPGAKVMPPTPEIFPGGSWEQPWAGGKLTIEYEAGGAYATIEGEGNLEVTIDGGQAHSIPVDGPKLYPLADHERHEAHTLTLEPSESLQIWSLSFAAGIPPPTPAPQAHPESS